MKIRILIGLVFAIFACVEQQGRVAEQTDAMRPKTQSENKSNNVIRTDNCNSWLDDADSTLSSGGYIKYMKGNGRIKIAWGNKVFSRTLKQDFGCDAAPSWIPTVRWATPEYIGLGYSCGSPCRGTVILPLNSHDSVVERVYDLERELSRNLIVYPGGEDYDRLTIENWVTGEKQEIRTEIICESTFLGYCIDSLKFDIDNLFIKWDESAGQRNTKAKGDLIKLEI
jgi:hypothetical protein